MDKVGRSFNALENDLKQPGQSSISTIRNYQFAILTYKPQEEFKMRRQLRSTIRSLEQKGWSVLTISLLQVLMWRLKSKDQRYIERLIERERRFFKRDKSRGLNELARAFAEHLEGSDGIAKDCAQLIEQHIGEDPDRTVVFIGRAGALYPFFRNSALLKHLHTTINEKVPIILLYPGKRHGDSGLSFMDKLSPDRDYRPRIY